jgi:hypothetical protein
MQVMTELTSSGRSLRPSRSTAYAVSRLFDAIFHEKDELDRLEQRNLIATLHTDQANMQAAQLLSGWIRTMKILSRQC